MKTVTTLSAILLVSVAAVPQRQQPTEMQRWRQQAQNVTITRDDWGIAHIRGKTDADAVFGMIYAQAEDDFNRVETNFINSQGRLAEAEGESAIWRDLRMKIFIHPDSMKAKYQTSPEWLRKLMVAWADGLNYYLATHPDVKPRVITRFEPWMALTFSEGSIGGDIEGISLGGIQQFYGGAGEAGTGGETSLDREPRGSNGIAIAPANTTNGRALLLINPHTSFFFRSELQMTSDEGLNAYGAATWGQFFIYQGFNDRLGWMHTTSGADGVDEYLETVTKKGDGYVYKFGADGRAVRTERITVPYRTASGGMESRTFTVYRTHHGPIVRAADGKWVSVKIMQEPVKALMQSYGRTKARTMAEYRKTMDLHANSSNNTLYADVDGNIAHFFTNFVPKRDPKFEWNRPVDGSDPATEWMGLLTNDEVPNAINPPSGWVYNSNDWPWDAAGKNSVDRTKFPRYVEKSNNESARGIHAIRVLSGKKDFTIQGLIDAAYDSYQPGFATMIPNLVRAWDQLPDSSSLKAKTREQIAVLRSWDFRWGVGSIANSLAVYYAQRGGGGGRRGGGGTATPEQMVANLAAASDTLTVHFGTWKTPWGDINRFQRNDGNIVQTFDDNKPSTPVGFTSATWGSLASFGARTYPGTKKMYGTSGNSFVAVVEFGKDSVRARAVSAGGESGDPRSKHFNDQAERYATGNLRQVYFYPNQLIGHTERTYRPGQ